MGPYVPSPKFLTISGDPGRVIYQILDMEEIRFSLKKGVFTVDVRFELTSTTTHGLSTTAFVKALGLWATSKRLTNRLPKLSLITLSPPFDQRDPWSSYGAVRAYSEVLNNLWGPRESDLSDS